MDTLPFEDITYMVGLERCHLCHQWLDPITAHEISLDVPNYTVMVCDDDYESLCS